MQQCPRFPPFARVVGSEPTAASHGGHVQDTAAPADVASTKPLRNTLVAALVVTPLAMTNLIGAWPLTHDSHVLPKAVAAWVLAAVALLAFGLYLRRAGTVRLSWWLLAPGVLAVWTGIATAASTAPVVSLVGRAGRFDGLLTTLTYVAFGFVSFQLCKRASDLTSLARAIAGTGLLVSAFGVVQTLGLDPVFYPAVDADYLQRAWSTLGGPTFLGGYLVLVIPVAFFAALAERSRVWRGVAWAAVGLSGLTVVGTGTRGAWAAVAAQTLVAAVIATRKGARPPRAGLVLVAAGLGLALILAAFGAAGIGPMGRTFSRAMSLLSGEDGSANARVVIAETAVRATAAHPVLGYGPDRFKIAFQQQLAAEHAQLFARGTVDNAHSVPLHLASTVGIVAALAWAAACLGALVVAAPAVVARDAGVGRLLVAGMWVAVLGFTFYSTFGIAMPGADVTAWVLLGALAGTRTAAERPVAPSASISLVAAAATLVLASAVLGGSMLVANHSFLRARMQVRGDAPGDAEESVRQAIARYPLEIEYLRLLPEVSENATSEERIAQLERVLAIEPEDLEALRLLRQLAQVTENAALERRALREIARLAPTAPGTE